MTHITGSETKKDSTSKVTAIMEVLCASVTPLTVRDVEEATGIPRSTAHRFLLSLEEQRWAYRDPLTDGYRPGIRFFLLQNASTFYDELISAAEPEMTQLMKTTGNTSILSVVEGSSGLCIHSVEPPAPIKFTAHRGMASFRSMPERPEKFSSPTAPRKSAHGSFLHRSSRPVGRKRSTAGNS